MTDSAFKIFRIVWLTSSILLVCVVAREQFAFYLLVIRSGGSFDFHLFRREALHMATNPLVLTSYLVLVASGLMYLLGPGRSELASREGKWLIFGLIFSIVIYGYLLLFP